LKLIPPPDEVRRELSRNLREQRLLKGLLKLSEQQLKVEEVSNDGEQREGPSLG
jgi:hypothetical protein